MKRVVFLIAESCHVRSHLAAAEDSGQPRAIRPPDVPLCTDLPNRQQEGRGRLQAKILSLRPERRSGDDQQVHGDWTHR